jgi:flagellin
MPISINTNVSALLAQNYLTTNQAGLSQALQRLSSGQRINSAADDAAGLAVAQQMLESSIAYRQGSRNANDGVSMVQTAESAMLGTLNNIQRMREIANEGSTGTLDTEDLANLNSEYQALLNEVERISATTTFNGISLLANSTGSVSIHVGQNNTTNDSISVTLTKTDTTTLAIDGTAVTSNTLAGTALGLLDTAIGTLTTGLAQLGANEKNLLSAIDSNNSQATDLDAAKSRVMDTDFAVESSNLAKFQVLNQSNIAMLAQANSVPGMVMQLLRG